MSNTFMISTGMRNHLLAGGSLKGAVDGMVTRIYADDGTIPASADAAVGSATLLCLISVSDLGTGMTLDDTPVNGVISKASAEELVGTNLASGTAAFFRTSGTADAGALSTTEKRIQGTVGLVDADYLVRDIVFVAAEEKRIDSFNIGMPASE